VNYKVAFAICVILAGAFLAGAYWAYKEIWPYDALSNLKASAGKPTAPKSGVKRLATDNVTLELDTFYVESQLPITGYGGGISAFDNKALIMSFRGEFFLYESENGNKSVARLNLALDNGYDAFQDYIKDNTFVTVDPTRHFRFIDLIYDRASSPQKIVVSHHQWQESAECFALRLSAFDLDPDQPLASQRAEPGDWRVVYETKPCLPVVSDVYYFPGDQSGGRIVRDGPDAVLFSAGDHAFDGWTIAEAHPQDPSSDYGKLLRVNVADGTATHVSIGHRNAQGLLIDNEANIWSTEHGPRGGDELNLIVDGRDYGWPTVTFGSQYGMYRWPMSETQNRHDGYEQPVLAWLPAIGVSNLIQVESFMPEWDGDLLVGSLRDRSLHRIRLHEGRAVFDHRIDIDVRIRDMDRWEDGTILLWTDDASIVELRPGETDEPDLNELVADLEPDKRMQTIGIIGACLQCHGETIDGEPGNAPTLRGVVGRKIAATNFDRYSEGLKNRTGVWNNETLNEFLRDVDGFAPGSTMYFSGITDEAIRSKVIEYLNAVSF
jgi:cytochrome c2